MLERGTLFRGVYEIGDKLSGGGMGDVYACVHRTTKKRRALKVMHAQLVERAELRARFELEARVTADIESDHIVETFDAGVDEATGMPFLVMELLRGEDLDASLRSRGRLPADEAVALLGQAASALDKTHAAGIVHRDLKPSNLFVTKRDDGTSRLKVLDFGIAKVVAESEKGAQHTATVGTAVYMAPEQIEGTGVGPHTDLYALAHVAFALLVGEPYWEEESRASHSPWGVWKEVMTGIKEPASLRAGRQGVALPAAFDAWFLRANAKDPVERFASAIALVVELAKAMGVAPPRAAGATTGSGLRPSRPSLAPATSADRTAELPKAATVVLPDRSSSSATHPSEPGPAPSNRAPADTAGTGSPFRPATTRCPASAWPPGPTVSYAFS